MKDSDWHSMHSPAMALAFLNHSLGLGLGLGSVHLIEPQQENYMLSKQWTWPRLWFRKEPRCVLLRLD